MTTKRIALISIVATAIAPLFARPAAAQWVYATSPDANLVSVIDPSHDSVAKTIPTPFSPGAIAVTPDGQFAYVANVCSAADKANNVAGTVTVLDLANNVVLIPSIPVGNCPTGVAVGTTANGVKAYVSNSPGSVSVIDVATNNVSTIQIPPDPTSGNVPAAGGVVLSPDGSTLYVDGNPIVVINTATNQIGFLSQGGIVSVDPGNTPWVTGGAGLTIGNNFQFFVQCTAGPVAFMPSVGRAFMLDSECGGVYDVTLGSSTTSTYGIANTFGLNLVSPFDLGQIAMASDGSRGYVSGILGSTSISSASATAVMNGNSVVQVNVTSPGSGYTTGPPAVEFISRDTNAIGSTQTGHGQGNPLGSVPWVSVDQIGSGYLQPPAVQFVCKDYPGQCANVIPATAVATISNGSISSVTVTNGGSGYINSPLVVFIRQNFTPALGSATVLNGGVVSVTVTNPGSGYSQPPAVEFVCGIAPANCGAGVVSFNPANDSQVASIPLVGAYAQGLAVAPTPAPNTPASPATERIPLSNVPVTVNFQSGITQAGFTGAVISTTGPSLQPNFQLSNPSVYYDIFTTATYPAGSMIQVCITSQGVTFTSRLVHFVGGSPVDITDASFTPPTICGTTSSLSPFAIEEPTSPGATATSTSISLTPATTIPYGTAATAMVTVSPTSGDVAGNVTVSVDGGAAITMALSGGSASFNLGVLGAGNHLLAANFAAQGSLLGSSASGTLTVARAPLTITASNRSKTYGQTVTLAGTEFTTSGLVNADNVASVALTSAGAAASASVAGSPYPITPSAAVGAGLGNYNITYVNGALTVSPALLTITAGNATKILDAPNPSPLPWMPMGFVSGENASALTANPTCSATATTASPVGTYPITCYGAAAANYTFTYVAGTLKILYATAIGHVIQPPINADGSSVYKQGRTVPAKFDVYDANGVAIGTPGVVSSFLLTTIMSGTTTTSVEDVVDSNNPDTAFRWDGQEWIFNITTGNLAAGNTYIYTITLNDGSTIVFQYGLR